MKAYSVREVMQSELEKELNRYSETGHELVQVLPAGERCYLVIWLKPLKK